MWVGRHWPLKRFLSSQSLQNTKTQVETSSAPKIAPALKHPTAADKHVLNMVDRRSSRGLTIGSIKYKSGVTRAILCTPSDSQGAGIQNHRAIVLLYQLALCITFILKSNNYSELFHKFEGGLSSKLQQQSFKAEGSSFLEHQSIKCSTIG